MMLFNVNKKKGHQGQTNKATHQRWRKRMGKNYASLLTMTLSLSFRNGLEELRQCSSKERKHKRTEQYFLHNAPQPTYEGGPAFLML